MPFKRFAKFLAVLALLAFAQLAPAAAEPFRIVGFGDSLMAGYRLATGESFPERLETMLRERGHDVVIENAGVSGDTTSGGLSRLDWSVPDGTDLVILELGANDMLRGIDPAVAERNLDAMIVRLKERGIDVLLAGMLAAPNLGADYAESFNAIYPRLAERHDVPLYPFFMEGLIGGSGLLLEDGMHPNAQGVERMVESALPYVEALLPASVTGG